MQRGLIPVGSIFPSGGMEASSTPWISSACHFLWSLGSGRASTTTLASSFCAAFHSVTDSLIIPNKAFSSSADWDGVVSGRRIRRIWCTVDSTWRDAITAPPRASMPRRVSTLHALSLRPPETERDSDTASKKWPTPLWSGRPSWGKNGCHMELHRLTEMTCRTPLSLRNSETSLSQIGVDLKMGSNLLNSWWTASESCIPFYLNQQGAIKIRDYADIGLPLQPVPAASESILTIRLRQHQIFAGTSPHWKRISRWPLLLQGIGSHGLVLDWLPLDRELGLYLFQLHPQLLVLLFEALFHPSMFYLLILQLLFGSR